MTADSQMNTIARRLVSGGASAIAIKVANAGLTYVMFVVLARAMSGAEYGHFAFGFTLAVTLSTVLTFGLPVTGLRFWPQYHVAGEADLARSFIARANLWVLAGSAGACAVGLAVIAAVDPGLLTARPWLVGVAVLVPLLAASEMIASSLRAADGMIAALAPRDVVWRLAVIAGAGVCLVSGSMLDAASAIFMAAVLLAVVLVPQAVHGVRCLGLGLGDLRGRTGRGTWRSSGLPNWGSSVLFALIQQFDVIIVGLYMTPDMTGHYFAAVRTAGLQNLMIIASNLVAAPLVSRYYHGGDMAALQRMSRLLLIGIAVPTLASLAVMIGFGREILALFDPAFADAYPALIILASGFTLSALAGPAASFMQMVGMERDYLTIMAVTYGAVIVSQFALVPVYGPLGAAIPNAVGAAVWSGWAVYKLRSRVGIDPSIAGLVSTPGGAAFRPEPAE